MKQKLSIIELFSGIGAQVRGFKNSGLYDAEVVATSEIDKDAMTSYAAVHCGLTPQMIEEYVYPSADDMIAYLEERNIGYVFEKNKAYDWQKKRNGADLKKYYLACKLSKNLGDITKIKELPYADMLTYSFPCTDISIAGLIQGIEKGKTRSGLLYEVERLLNVAKENDTLPKYLLLENVKNLVGNKFRPQFNSWCEWLSNLGYNTYWQVLNAKNCGIPQNRERVFAISIRKDIDTGRFTFPNPFDTGIRLKHILDDVVPDKFYIHSEAANKCLNEMAENGTLDEEAKGLEVTEHYDNNGVIIIDGNSQLSKCLTGGQIPVNANPDGTSRTIKSQYGKTSIPNLQSHGTFGATGAMKKWS